ncbi:Tetrapyrrole biosynthesis, uroporphyrinogen III synthase [Kalmanozyma brasiliensis GHG001]|uniref:Tetrapyrrole biosynthesis, uroporphyrinogen III synthase n=1 Tax=Kalmanozyma brasiliensis (strain GHG001) TaxID=1365824 RepID=UPI0028682230|nr:Tetrapyrrole biosynthesis, uroporphyrinogen III synthase [Kalmanozyma brasiliensis GHG001]EST09086.2 Tetrapyrrole biosynthesis, uroporphyrinogen III synthase [Kalmanozyma brasiliensis GHG001]
MMPVVDDGEEPPPPITILLLRTPVSMTKGTDPYHDAFGSFCLPSFASSALESGTSTPLPSMSMSGKPSLATTAEHGAIDLIRTALSQQAAASHNAPTEHAPSSPPLPLSATGRRKGKFIHDQPRLMTHHLSYPADANGNEIEIEYCVTSFPILAHKFVNQDLLIDRLLHGTKAQEDLARSAYRGMIVTSQRAVEAYISAGVKAQDILRSQSKTSSSSPTQWTRVPFFAVGPATSSALRTVPLAPWLRPRLVMGGEATGTGETLARYVIRHFSSPSILDQNSDLLSAEQAPPLLYLVGDKNASTIPDMLSSASPPTGPVPFEELQVYETAPDPHFAEGCEVLLKTLPSVVSRPPSRRPSHSSLNSRSGSRRASSGSADSPADRTVTASVSSNASRKSSADDLHSRARSSAEFGRNASTSSHRSHLSHVPSVGTPLGVSTMTSTETAANKRLDSLAIPAAAGGSPQLMASPATIEPGVINPIEEESVLKMLRSKVNNVSGGSGSNSGALQRIARPDWVVFFSPSGVNYALEEFRRRRWMPPDFRQQQQKEQAQADGLQNSVNTTVTSHAITTGKGSTGSPRKYPRIAVLGSTTRAWMVENLGIEPDAVALKPGPKELKDAIEAVELRLRAKA